MGALWVAELEMVRWLDSLFQESLSISDSGCLICSSSAPYYMWLTDVILTACFMNCEYVFSLSRFCSVELLSQEPYFLPFAP